MKLSKGDVEISTCDTFDFDACVKSVGYVYHGSVELFDFVSGKSLSGMKPWLPAVNEAGTTMSEILNDCHSLETGFKTVYRNGKITVKFPVFYKLVGDVYNSKPCAYYRTPFDSAGFAVKIVEDYLGKPFEEGCYPILDRSIEYTNKPSTVISYLTLMQDNEYSKDKAIQILVNNGRGSFYKLYNPRMK